MTDKNDGDYFCFDCGALINDVNTEFADGEPFCVDCITDRKPKTGPKNDGDQAFPTGDHTHGGHAGMSLRDWFAGQAMQALIGKHKALSNNGEYAPKVDCEYTFRSSLASGAYAYADAMIAERDK